MRRDLAISAKCACRGIRTHECRAKRSWLDGTRSTAQPRVSTHPPRLIGSLYLPRPLFLVPRAILFRCLRR